MPEFQTAALFLGATLALNLGGVFVGLGLRLALAGRR